MAWIGASAKPHQPPGSMSAALMSAAPAGEVRNLNNTLAASGSVAVVITHGHGLQLGRQRSERLGAGDAYDFADQLDAELGLAARHDFGTGPPGHSRSIWLGSRLVIPSRSRTFWN